MKKLLILIMVVALSGCLATPVKRNFPDVPKELMVSCPDLKQTDETTKLSDVIKVVTDNYSQYHECRIVVDAWIEWYSTQKQIFDSVK